MAAEEIFGDIANKLKDSEKRWDEIELLYNNIKKYCEWSQSGQTSMDFDQTDLARLLLLLTDQLRPMCSVKNQMKDIEEGFKDILNKINRRP